MEDKESEQCVQGLSFSSPPQDSQSDQKSIKLDHIYVNFPNEFLKATTAEDRAVNHKLIQNTFMQDSSMSGAHMIVFDGQHEYILQSNPQQTQAEEFICYPHVESTGDLQSFSCEQENLYQNTEVHLPKSLYLQTEEGLEGSENYGQKEENRGESVLIQVIQLLKQSIGDKRLDSDKPSETEFTPEQREAAVGNEKQDYQTRVKGLLSEAVTLLCRACVCYNSLLNVEGLLGITVDKSEIFLVSIREQLDSSDTITYDKENAAMAVHDGPSESFLIDPISHTESVSEQNKELDTIMQNSEENVPQFSSTTLNNSHSLNGNPMDDVHGNLNHMDTGLITNSLDNVTEVIQSDTTSLLQSCDSSRPIEDLLITYQDCLTTADSHIETVVVVTDDQTEFTESATSSHFAEIISEPAQEYQPSLTLQQNLDAAGVEKVGEMSGVPVEEDSSGMELSLSDMPGIVGMGDLSGLGVADHLDVGDVSSTYFDDVVICDDSHNSFLAGVELDDLLIRADRTKFDGSDLDVMIGNDKSKIDCLSDGSSNDVSDTRLVGSLSMALSKTFVKHEGLPSNSNASMATMYKNCKSSDVLLSGTTESSNLIGSPEWEEESDSLVETGEVAPLNLAGPQDLTTEIGKLHHSCEVCGKQFKSEGVMKKHKCSNSKDMPEPLNLIRQPLDLTTGRLDILDLSTAYVYADLSGDGGLTCVCGRSYTDYTDYAHHATTCSRARMTPYRSCETCGKFFFSNNGYLKHVKLHVGEYKFHCTVCHKGFFDRTHLRAHNDSAHSKVRRYPCSRCDKSFCWKHHLKRHLLNCGEPAESSESSETLKKVEEEDCDTNDDQSKYRPGSCDVIAGDEGVIEGGCEGGGPEEGRSSSVKSERKRGIEEEDENVVEVKRVRTEVKSGRSKNKTSTRCQALRVVVLDSSNLLKDRTLKNVTPAMTLLPCADSELSALSFTHQMAALTGHEQAAFFTGQEDVQDKSQQTAVLNIPLLSSTADTINKPASEANIAAEASLAAEANLAAESSMSCSFTAATCTGDNTSLSSTASAMVSSADTVTASLVEASKTTITDAASSTMASVINSSAGTFTGQYINFFDSLPSNKMLQNVGPSSAPIWTQFLKNQLPTSNQFNLVLQQPLTTSKPVLHNPLLPSFSQFKPIFPPTSALSNQIDIHQNHLPSVCNQIESNRPDALATSFSLFTPTFSDTLSASPNKLKTFQTSVSSNLLMPVFNTSLPTFSSPDKSLNEAIPSVYSNFKFFFSEKPQTSSSQIKPVLQNLASSSALPFTPVLQQTSLANKPTLPPSFPVAISLSSLQKLVTSDECVSNTVTVNSQQTNPLSPKTM